MFAYRHRVETGLGLHSNFRTMPAAEHEHYRDFDYVICEADLNRLRAVVEELEKIYSIELTRQPSPCLSMLRAEDSLEKQEFFLGEALTTECEVRVDSLSGYGLCLGDEAQRCYCIAVLDALRESRNPAVEAFIEEEGKLIAAREQQEFGLIQRTQVDFKLMEEV